MKETDCARRHDHPWREFEGTIATSHPVAKYGGIRIPPETLKQMAEALNSGKVPMLAQHDPRRRLRTQQLTATVVTLPDNEQALRLTCLIHPGDLDLIEGLRGMSFSTSVLVKSTEGQNPDAGFVELHADAAAFNDEAIERACETMSAAGHTKAFRLFQFADPDQARIILDIAYNIVLVLGPGLATSVIYDGLRYLFRNRAKGTKKAPVQLEINTSMQGGDVKAVIMTGDPDVAKAALAAYSEAVKAVAMMPPSARPVLDWDAASRTWLPALEACPESQEDSENTDYEGTENP